MSADDKLKTTRAYTREVSERRADDAANEKLEYPVRVMCPGCNQRKEVFVSHEFQSADTTPREHEVHRIAPHAIVVSQISDDLRDSCTISYPCPASGAEVSAFRKPRNG